MPFFIHTLSSRCCGAQVYEGIVLRLPVNMVHLVKARHLVSKALANYFVNVLALARTIAAQKHAIVLLAGVNFEQLGLLHASHLVSAHNLCFVADKIAATIAWHWSPYTQVVVNSTR